MKFPLGIKSSTIHAEFWTLAPFQQGGENSGSWLQFPRDGTRNTWQAGMSSDNFCVIRAPDATYVLSVDQNGDTTSGDLESQSLTINKTSNDDMLFKPSITTRTGRWPHLKYNRW